MIQKPTQSLLWMRIWPRKTRALALYALFALVVGLAIAGAVKSFNPAPTCSNCGEPHAEGDVFCEACGFDFLSGTLPEEETAAPLEVPASAEPAATNTAVVQVDVAFFERMGFAGVEVPSDLPEPVRIELPPTDILVGRHSESRGTFPEIDLSMIFGDGSAANDPAVSSSHCRLHRSNDGWAVTDLDSTNGTYLDDDADPLAPGVSTPVPDGVPIYVGAWTKITIE